MPLSLSQHNLYYKCPAAYDFRHNKRIAEPAGPAAQRGTDIHAQLEYYLATGLWSGGIREFTRNKAESMRSQGYIAEYKLALDKDWKPVDWKDDKAYVRCVIDALLFLETEAHMGEWKTGKVYDDHVSQRRLYLCMVLAAHPLLERAKIETIYADHDHAQETVLARPGLDREIEYWKGRFDTILRDTFYSPRTGQYCRWCAYSKEKGGPCIVA